MFLSRVPARLAA